jgi:hypothetical protein
MNAAVPKRSNLSRLEHELQTAVDGGMQAAAISLSAGGIGETLRRHFLVAGARRTVSSGCPAPLRVLALLVRSASLGACLGAGADRKLRPPPLPLSGALLADVPITLTGHNRNLLTVSPIFLRPGIRNWQAGCGICPKEPLFAAPSAPARALVMYVLSSD